MVDMSLLPERKINFIKTVSTLFNDIKTEKEEEWFMLDPIFVGKEIWKEKSTSLYSR